ncbi:hypothetical protein CPLU01_12562 [Colletotrichum plurivorum]|uniref:Uncharacterized protein n=1 Tax=Colletotrichum plurivorum TaxID=2175906 RepID=A0A8H6N6C2_9PEZI|nr:hypothetical protein CPLU01_12562 [Colletotrichum plurivorum]
MGSAASHRLKQEALWQPTLAPVLPPTLVKQHYALARRTKNHSFNHQASLFVFTSEGINDESINIVHNKILDLRDAHLDALQHVPNTSETYNPVFCMIPEYNLEL